MKTWTFREWLYSLHNPTPERCDLIRQGARWALRLPIDATDEQIEAARGAGAGVHGVAVKITHRGESVYLVLGDVEYEIAMPHTLAEQLRVATSKANLALDARLRAERLVSGAASFRERHPDAVAITGYDHAYWSPSEMVGYLRGLRISPEHLPAESIPPMRVSTLGGRISHMWSGGQTAACGAQMWRPRTSGKPWGKCGCAP